MNSNGQAKKKSAIFVFKCEYLSHRKTINCESLIFMFWYFLKERFNFIYKPPKIIPFENKTVVLQTDGKRSNELNTFSSLLKKEDKKKKKYSFRSNNFIS